MVDEELVARKLLRLEERVRRIQQVVPSDAGAFRRDRTAQEVVAFNLVQAVQTLIDLGAHVVSDAGWSMPDTFRSLFTLLGERGVLPADLASRLGAAAGMRNLLIHQYDDVDVDLLHEVATSDVEDLLDAASHIATLATPDIDEGT